MNTSKIWFVSDTHFYHKNILKFTDENDNLIRGSKFECIEDMNQAIIDNWNSQVKPYDKVYHLGDVTFKFHDEFVSLWKSLNGIKNLVVGNHDRIGFFVERKLCSKIYMSKKIRENNIILTHMPVHPSTFGYRIHMNIHGHVHQRSISDSRYRNVSLEVIDYKPISLEQIIEEAITDYE